MFHADRLFGVPVYSKRRSPRALPVVIIWFHDKVATNGRVMLRALIYQALIYQALIYQALIPISFVPRIGQG
jgi:hypothetical protein